MRQLLKPIVILGTLTLIVTTTSIATFANEIEFEAVFHDADRPVQTSALMQLDTFLETGREIAESGLRIFDVETVLRDGKRQYVGLWTPGGGFSHFAGPIGPIDFGNVTREMRDDDGAWKISRFSAPPRVVAATSQSGATARARKSYTGRCWQMLSEPVGVHSQRMV